MPIAGVPGKGLVLPLCCALAQALGGRIVFQSVPYRGSMFSLVLPRRYQAQAPDSAAARSPLRVLDGAAQSADGIHEER